MKTAVLTIFGIISFVLTIGFLAFALYLYKSKKRKSAKWGFTSTQVFTIGVFFSVVLIFIPIYYTYYDFGDSYKFIRPFLMSFHNSIRVFILDGEFDIIVEALKDQNVVLRVGFSVYSAFLYLLAPILTFTNVLSLFKNAKNGLRYIRHRNKKHYILSALNEKSIALAKSICNEQPKSVIVFTDVFEQNEENNYELLTEARSINAICLKKDITHLDFYNKKGNVEIFLIGEDESENVSQAAKLTTELNQRNSKHNVKIFVFSSTPSAAYILDSISYDNLLEYAHAHQFGEDCFKLRRISERQQLIWNTIPTMKLFDLADRNEKTLSVLILGFGSYGMELFKMLVWYCQFEGYKLQITVVDKQGEKNLKEKQYIESIIDRMAPDLLKNDKCEKVGNPQYDIEIFQGVDVTTSDIDKLFLYKGENSERLKKAMRLKNINLAFVALGNDDRNIEASIHLRNLFDRVNHVKADKDITWKDEKVDIYSVVYDEQKFGILYNENTDNLQSNSLLNHKDVPYHIHFIGGLSSQFAYKNIYDAELEKSAYKHHREWVDIEKAIYNILKEKGDTETLKNNYWAFMDEETEEAEKDARKKYEQYEYYRLSSIAKELYKREIMSAHSLSAQVTCLAKSQICNCDNCVRRKRNEHMRWTAYTRMIGFSYGDEKVRADRALLHDKLCGWEELSDVEKYKD